MKDEFKTKWLIFKQDYLPKKITQVWEIKNLTGTFLGLIKWYSPWRCYCFFPVDGTAFNSTCIKDILDFINKLMEARKKVCFKCGGKSREGSCPVCKK